MVTFTETRLKELFENFKRKRIAVVGDLMLDRYFWGSVARISPEAPVPVVEIESESARLGGAANVAHNIKSLGGEPMLIGVVGNDNSGNLLRDILIENRFTPAGLIVDATRPTTVKTRVIAHSQHVVRIDRETKADISYTLQHKILDVLRQNIHSLDAIILEDYDKGVIVKSLIKQLVDLANEYRKIVTADPKFNNFFDYRGVTVFKPNRKEVEEVMGIKLVDDATVEEAGKALMERLQVKNVLLTRGERGMTLFEQDGSVTHVATIARKVADVSGAGDTVISTLTVALAGGANVREAATLANYAGGIVCEEVGIVPIAREALLSAVMTDSL
ncbi:MAG: D-glycero-beta-D-manno-heptose-7-phosphate kinase [Bacteroidota bacterium]